MAGVVRHFRRRSIHHIRKRALRGGEGEFCERRRCNCCAGVRVREIPDSNDFVQPHLAAFPQLIDPDVNAQIALMSRWPQRWHTLSEESEVQRKC